jgi:hypothetical protein
MELDPVTEEMEKIQQFSGVPISSEVAAEEQVIPEVQPATAGRAAVAAAAVGPGALWVPAVLAA